MICLNRFLNSLKLCQKLDKRGGNSFATKSWLSANGNFDTSKLTKYVSKDFVVDDDIVSGRYYVCKSLSDNTELVNPLFELYRDTGEEVPLYFNRAFSEFKNVQSTIGGITVNCTKDINPDTGEILYGSFNGMVLFIPNNRTLKLYAINTLPIVTGTFEFTMPDDSIVIIRTAVTTSPTTGFNVSPTQIFSQKISNAVGSSASERIIVSGASAKPTVSIAMQIATDNGMDVILGGVSYSITQSGTLWYVDVWPTSWYNAPGPTGSGSIAMVPGYYCRGNVAITVGSTTKNVSINGNIHN